MVWKFKTPASCVFYQLFFSKKETTLSQNSFCFSTWSKCPQSFNQTISAFGITFLISSSSCLPTNLDRSPLNEKRKKIVKFKIQQKNLWNWRLLFMYVCTWWKVLFLQISNFRFRFGRLGWGGSFDDRDGLNNFAYLPSTNYLH